MLSQFAGVAGALLPAMIGSRFGRWRPLSVGIAGGALALAFLIGRFEYLPFTLWVCAYNFFWNMTHPFLLGSMASFDRRGRGASSPGGFRSWGLQSGRLWGPPSFRHRTTTGSTGWQSLSS